MSDFRYDPDRHRYTLDGVVLPHVTEVLEAQFHIVPPWVASGHTRAWYLQRGRAYHYGTQLLDEGDLAMDTLDGRIRGYVESYARWKDLTKFVPRVIERPTYHEVYRYGVTPDREGELFGDPSVVEFKPEHVEDWVAFQTAAQAAVFSPHHRRFGLALHADGRVATLRPFTDTHDFAQFVGALGNYQWRRQHGDLT